MSLSLNNARMPRLSDKIDAQAEAAEKLREKLEKKDVEDTKIIKKASKKK